MKFYSGENNRHVNKVICLTAARVCSQFLGSMRAYRRRRWRTGYSAKSPAGPPALQAVRRRMT